LMIAEIMVNNENVNFCWLIVDNMFKSLTKSRANVYIFNIKQLNWLFFV